MEFAVPGIFQLALDREERQLEFVLHGHAQRLVVSLVLGFRVQGFGLKMI